MNHIQENILPLYMRLAGEFVRFRSISTDQQYSDEMTQTVHWLQKQFGEHGFDVKTIEGYSNPIIVASYTVDKKLPTALVYGHYDVQPASLEEGWSSDPFTLTSHKGRLVARGAIDNKGQVGVHLATIFSLIAEKKLSYNVKFLMEGDEETGSPHLERFVKDHADLLHADFILISDGDLSAGYPTIECGFRGELNLQITIETSDRDLHSGSYGGIAPSATHEMINFLAQVISPDQRILIPGWYDDIPKYDQKLVSQQAALPFDKAEYERITGTETIFTQPGYNVHTQTAFQPSAVITSLTSGYQGPGFRNSIAGHAEAKINFRFAPGQDANRFAKLFRNFAQQKLPPYAHFTIQTAEPTNGVLISPDSPYIEKAKTLLKQVYQKEPLIKFIGASLPITTLLKKALDIPQLLIPLANEDGAMHGANENFEEGHLLLALLFSYSFFERAE